MIFQVQRLITRLLGEGATPFAEGDNLETPLHFAVKHKFKSVCTKLLEHQAKADARDKNDILPYTLALRDKNDEIAAMLIGKMNNELHVNNYNFL